MRSVCFQLHASQVCALLPSALHGGVLVHSNSSESFAQSEQEQPIISTRFAETWIPPENAGLDQAQSVTEDIYSYDALNRLSSVTEQRMDAVGGWVWQPQFRQAYSYDRYGNRTIDAVQTWGAGINNKQFDVETTTNRLKVPSGQAGVASGGQITTNQQERGQANNGAFYDLQLRVPGSQTRDALTTQDITVRHYFGPKSTDYKEIFQVSGNKIRFNDRKRSVTFTPATVKKL